MNIEHLILCVATLLFGIGCWATYNDNIKNSIWYYPLGVSLGTITATLWFYVCTLLPDKNKVYVYSLFWDTIMVMVYYGLPILFFGVKLDKITAVGSTLILAGIMVLKFKTNAP